MAGPADRVQQMVIAKLSLRLSLNNPYTTSDIVRRKCSTKRQREREREKKKERERERASELDAKWYGKCRKRGTTGWVSLIGFARWVNVRNSFCLAYAKFNGLSCMVPGYRFWRGLSLDSVSCTSLTKNSCNTKVNFNNFDRDSYIISNIFCVWYLWGTGSNGPNRVNRDMSRLVLLALNSFLILARLSRCTDPSGSV